MTVSRLWVLLAALCFGAPASLRAQTLPQLYEAARGYDATWLSAKAQYDASLFRAEQARAGVLPAASLASQLARSRYSSTAPDLDAGITTQSATLNATQPLYRPANVATWEQGKRQVLLAQEQLLAASQDLMVRVSQAYFDVLAAQDTLSFVRAQRAAVDEQLASAKRNFELGTTTVTDSLEAQARHDLVVAQDLAADNDLRVKQLALDALVGRTDAKPVPLIVGAALPAPQPANMDAWIGLAEQDSPAVRQARVAIELAQLETEKARAGDKPTVDLVASYGITRNPGGNATVAGTTRNDLATIGLSLNVPLFAGFAVQNRIRETLALEDKAQADLDATSRLVAQAVRTAYLGVLSGRSQVKALEAAEASTQSALEANKLGYEVGVRINIDVLNAQSQLYQTKRDLAQARYAAVLGDLKLRQAAGTLSPADLGRLDALLAK